MTLKRPILVLLTLLLAVPVFADGVNFEEVSTTTCFIAGDTYDSNAYHFSTGAPPVAEGYANQLFVCGGMLLNNDVTNSLINANGPSDVVMQLGDGTVPFSLLSFEAGTRTADYDPTSPSDLHNSTGLLLIGIFADGSGVVTESFAFDGLNWSTFTPNGFTGLSSVEFIALGDSPAPENSLDNIVTTPEPGSLVLLGSGLAGIVGKLRRRFA